VKNSLVSFLVPCSYQGHDFRSTATSVTCPAGCQRDDTQGEVYGTDVYQEESNICLSAIHSGVISGRFCVLHQRQ